MHAKLFRQPKFKRVTLANLGRNKAAALWSHRILIHWGWDKMATIFQTTFSNGFLWMKMHKFLSKFHWSLLLGVQLTIFLHWFRWWLGADQATSHYVKHWWPRLLTHICVTWPQWVDRGTHFTKCFGVIIFTKIIQSGHEFAHTMTAELLVLVHLMIVFRERAAMPSIDVFFVVSMNTLLNK